MKYLKRINEDFYSLENEAISNIKDFLVDLVDDGFNIRCKVIIKMGDISGEMLRGIRLEIKKEKRFNADDILDYILTVISYMNSKGFGYIIYTNSDTISNSNHKYIIKNNKIFKKYGSGEELKHDIKKLTIKFTL